MSFDGMASDLKTAVIIALIGGFFLLVICFVPKAYKIGFRLLGFLIAGGSIGYSFYILAADSGTFTDPTKLGVMSAAYGIWGIVTAVMASKKATQSSPPPIQADSSGRVQPDFFAMTRMMEQGESSDVTAQATAKRSANPSDTKPARTSESKCNRRVVELLRNNGISVVDDWSVLEPEHRLGYRVGLFPYFRIEITQLFSNPNCGVTDRCKQWRENPFASTDLGYIDVSISDSTNVVCISALTPGGIVSNAEVLQQKIQQMKSLLPQCKLQGIMCGSIDSIPYLWLLMEPRGSDALPAGTIFDMIQLFALDVHRIFGSIETKHLNKEGR